jgi:CubicO group peptidase (beta-lactamase class C family)
LFATFVLHQAENGRLDLDKPISTYLGDEVAGSRVVTARMLLTHTVGYPDLYGDLATVPLFPPGDRYDPNRPYPFEMLNAGIRQPVARASASSTPTPATSSWGTSWPRFSAAIRNWLAPTGVSSSGRAPRGLR